MSKNPEKILSHYFIDGFSFSSEKLPPALYIVATPIGNLKDISIRALQTLSSVDLILAEDTRISKKLLNHYGIKTAMRSYHEYSKEGEINAVIALLKEGKSLALVSDAGTPLISDPGYPLIQKALEADINIQSVPGASAVINALVLSGLPTESFFFEGFLSSRQGARKKRLDLLKGIPGTLVFYESPHRIQEMLEDCKQVLGNRKAVVLREMTKYYETVLKGSLEELIQYYVQEGTPKGEIVVLVEAQKEQVMSNEELTMNMDSLLEDALKVYSIKDAATLVSQKLGISRKKIYSRALEFAKK